MNLSEVRTMYSEPGKERLRNMSKPAVKVLAKKSLSLETFNRVTKLIKTNRKISRQRLLDSPGVSRTTTELCIKALYDKFLIKKDKDYSLPSNPAVYVWLGV